MACHTFFLVFLAVINVLIACSLINSKYHLTVLCFFLFIFDTVGIHCPK